MKKILMIALVLAVGTSIASAQVPKPFEIYLGGGVSVPSSDQFKDEWNTGFNGMAAAGLNFTAVPGLKGLLKVQYHRFSRDSYREIGGDLVTADQTLNVFMVGVDGLFRFGTPGGPFSPYSSAGIGAALMNFSDLEQEGVAPLSYDNQTEFYFNLTGGVEFRATPALNVFLQASYVSINTEGDAIAIIPITAGVRF